MGWFLRLPKWAKRSKRRTSKPRRNTLALSVGHGWLVRKAHEARTLPSLGLARVAAAIAAAVIALVTAVNLPSAR